MALVRVVRSTTTLDTRRAVGCTTGPVARRVFITVAEVSGDKHAAQLIHSLRQLDPSIIIEGLGGPEMAAAGATLHRNTVTRAAMGWRGALRAAEVYQMLRWTRRHFDDHPPDLQIGVDSPSMNFHFARAAHERGIPALQYVAPQLWAWAPWRMKKLRRWVDHVACILPFEEDYFRAHGVNATFVGHPLFDELPPRRETPAAERFPSRPPVIGLLPGSRKSEAQANFPRLLKTAARIIDAFSDAKFLVPTTAGTHHTVEQALKPSAPLTIRKAIEVGQDRFDEMVPRCDLCITVSGTATLHVASFGVPMIVVYRANPLVWHAAGRWLVPARTFALVNLLAKNTEAGVVAGPGGHTVPEFVPWLGPPDRVADLAIDYLRHPERLASQRRALSQLVGALDHPGASMNVARLALGMIRSPETVKAGTDA
ncbi:MAG: lpxB [Phycisphaerales bacterium]|nr:lpxB [Phycisphaerales bacterium]